MSYVAKSYQEWEKVSDEYEVAGRRYVKVRSPKGAIKQVRVYSEVEYRKMYPAQAPSPQNGESRPCANSPVVKNILGFQNGYIWIFKGDLDMAEYWFNKMPECRYHVTFGWYVVSTEEIPASIPSCIKPVKLEWEKVGNTDGTLLPKTTIEAAIQDLIYGEHPSKWQGTIGDRIERAVQLIKIIDLGTNQYGGSSRIYIFEDEFGNQYTWTTGTTKDWNVGDTLTIRGTIKSLEKFRNICQTNLQRVSVV